MSDTAEPLDLDAIRERDSDRLSENACEWSWVYHDRRALLAEVDRLRVALTTARRDALTEAADAVHDRFEGGHLNTRECSKVRDWLRDRADRIERQEKDR